MSNSKIVSNAQSSNNNGRWALLIGIDYYEPYGKRNLSGCVRDVTGMKGILESTLDVPPNNITELLGPLPDGNKKSWKWKPPLRPTREQVIAAIRKLIAEVPRGDFVYIHFSGHGARMPTIYNKPKPQKDEVLLCAKGTIIRDVELGVLLEDLSKERTVLAVLDCCHSGGALRAGKLSKKNAKVRSWGGAVVSTYGLRLPLTQCWRHLWQHKARPTGTRNRSEWIGVEDFNKLVAQSHQSWDSHWFYKDRPFNLIAACQPHEKAWEFPDDNEDMHGLLSSTLSMSIKILGTAIYSTNYKTLMDIIQAHCCGVYELYMQHPLIFGENRNVLFGLSRGTWDPTDGAVFSIARGQGDSGYELNRGLGDGVKNGDRYQLTSPQGNTSHEGNASPLYVEVVEVKDYTARAETPRSTGPGDYDTWFARRYSRAAATLIYVPPCAESNEAIEGLKRNWEGCMDPANPLKFNFDDDPTGIDPDYCVRISDGCYDISFGDGQQLPNPIPPLEATEESKTITKLCSILVHIQRFMELVRLQPPTKWKTTPQLRLTVSDDTQPISDVLKKVRIDFTNESSKNIYLTIMDLQPDWSVKVIIPNSGEQGLLVEAGLPIESINGSLKVPSSLQPYCGRKFCDRFKMIVSNQAHNFSHYSLPSLHDFKFPAPRNFEEDWPSQWDVYEEAIWWNVPEVRGSQTG